MEERDRAEACKLAIELANLLRNSPSVTETMQAKARRLLNLLERDR